MRMTEVRSRGTLIAAIGSGKAHEFLIFRGQRVPKDGAITKSCLSQWDPARFE